MNAVHNSATFNPNSTNQRFDVPNTTVQITHMSWKLEPVGIPALVHSNPIARYNFFIHLYNISKVQGIQLTEIYIPCAISLMYDAFIFFYRYLALTLTCGLAQKRGLLFTLFMLAIYFFLLCGPYISIVTLVFTFIFVAYYVVGVVIKVRNLNKLGSYSITYNMVHEREAPPFDKDYTN